MSTCRFRYVDGSYCDEPCRGKVFGDTIPFKGDCPTENREVIRHYKPVLEHSKFCAYHERMMRGELLPATFQNIPEDIALKIRAAHKRYEEEFEYKKNVLNRQEN